MMRWVSWLALVVVAAGTFARSAGQDGPAPIVEQKAPEKGRPVIEAKGKITGMVICADTHRPARGAMVMIGGVPGADGTTPPGQREVTTRVGLDGRYSADHMAPGEYSVMAFFPGYISPMAGLESGDMENADPKKMRELLTRNGTVMVRGAETETFDVTLRRGAAISGRVLYSDGSPAAQVVIDVEDVNSKRKQGASADDVDIDALMRTVFTHESLGTNDQGRFRIAGLEAGTYRVSAVQSAGGAMGSDMGEGIGVMIGGMNDPAALHFYSGDTIYRKAAKTYELRPGDEVADIEITIPEDSFHSVSGTLTALTGDTINEATLKLTDTADETLVFASKLGPDGSFAFPTVPPGTYTLTAKDAKSLRTEPDEKGGVKPAPPVNFEATSVGVIVKDGDVADVQLSLKVAADDGNKAPAPAPGTPQ